MNHHISLPMNHHIPVPVITEPPHLSTNEPPNLSTKEPPLCYSGVGSILIQSSSILHPKSMSYGYMLHVGIRVCRHNPSDLTLSPLADPCWGYWPAGGEGGGGGITFLYSWRSHSTLTHYLPLQLFLYPTSSYISLSYLLIYLSFSILPPHISLFLNPTSSYSYISLSYLLISLSLSFRPL